VETVSPSAFGERPDPRPAAVPAGRPIELKSKVQPPMRYKATTGEQSCAPKQRRASVGLLDGKAGAWQWLSRT
jgi:hypothetical protein